VERLRRENPEIRILPRGWRFMEYVAWNNRDPLFSDPRVRRALTMCIDCDLLIQVLLTGGGECFGRPCTGSVTPELCGACNDTIEPLPHDVKAARAILNDLGWMDSDGDGVLDRDGTPFSFTLKTSAGNPRREQACVLIQAQLKEAGFEVELEQLEGMVLFEQMCAREFQAALGGWSAGLYVDPRSFWHSGDEYVYNFTSYSNSAVDELIARGEGETDPEAANAIWHEMQELIYDDQPYTFLYWVNNLMAIHQRFEGVEANLLTPLYGLERWWENPNWKPDLAEDG
jgi:peptide/nickel transport system substrate-binding protein